MIEMNFSDKGSYEMRITFLFFLLFFTNLSALESEKIIKFDESPAPLVKLMEKSLQNRIEAGKKAERVIKSFEDVTDFQKNNIVIYNFIGG